MNLYTSILFDNNDLLIRLQEGNASAFEEIYWKYHASLYLNILKLVKDTIAAEDLLQEVFISLWQNRELMNIEKPVANWLFVVSYNKSISYLKKTVKENMGNTIHAGTEISNDIHNNYADLQWELLQKGLQKLSPQKRRVFQLCKLESKTYKEAAEEMQISKHTVKEYLQDTMAFLKSYVKSHSEIVCAFGAYQLLFYFL